MTIQTQQRVQSIVTQFRNYDQCVKDWLGGFPSKEDGSPTPVVVATPDRAFSAMQTLLQIKGIQVPDGIKSIPLPFISLTSGSIEFDPSRFHGNASMVLGTTSDKDVTYSHKFPMPYNISYRAEFWTKNQESMNAFRYWIAVDYSPGHENFLTVDLSDVWPAWKRKLVPITNDGLRFVGEHEPAEKHRVLRMVAEFKMKAWIVPPITITKNIHKIIVDTYLTHSTADDIRYVTGPEVDANPGIYNQVDHDEIT